MAQARRRKGRNVQNLGALSAFLLSSSSREARFVPLIRGLARLGALWIPRAEVRAETWAIGVRHRGQVVEGARQEGRAAGLSFRRAILLKAVIREHSCALRAKARKARA